MLYWGERFGRKGSESNALSKRSASKGFFPWHLNLQTPSSCTSSFARTDHFTSVTPKMSLDGCKLIMKGGALLGLLVEGRFGFFIKRVNLTSRWRSRVNVRSSAGRMRRNSR